jgi:oxalate decarboxylase
MFDDGSQSEYSTSLLSDMVRSMPAHVIETSLGVPIEDLSKLPKQELYIFESEVPGLLENDRVKAPGGQVPDWFSHNLSNAPAIDCPAGTMREVTQAEFPAMDTMSIEEVTIEPGAMRTLHWHAQDEWQYYLQGTARVTVFMPQGGSSATFDYRAGDVGYIPGIAAHYVENIGNEPLKFLGVFRKTDVANFSFAQWMALTPPGLVQANLGLSEEAVASLVKGRRDIVPIRGNR